MLSIYDREFSRDGEHTREVSSSVDVGLMKSKSVSTFGYPNFLLLSLFVYASRYLMWFRTKFWLGKTNLAREQLFGNIKSFTFFHEEKDKKFVLLPQLLGPNHLKFVDLSFFFIFLDLTVLSILYYLALEISILSIFLLFSLL